MKYANSVLDPDLQIGLTSTLLNGEGNIMLIIVPVLEQGGLLALGGNVDSHLNLSFF